MTDLPQRELDRLYKRAEKELSLKGKSKEEIQRTLSDKKYWDDWITNKGKKRLSSGRSALSERISKSFRVTSYFRKGKNITGYRAARKGWTDKEVEKLRELEKTHNLHEIARLTGRSYDSVRRKRQELNK